MARERLGRGLRTVAPGEALKLVGQGVEAWGTRRIVREGARMAGLLDKHNEDYLARRAEWVRENAPHLAMAREREAAAMMQSGVKV